MTGKGLLLALACFAIDAAAATQSFDAFEATIPELQEAMASGQTTSEQLVRQYLERVGAFDQAGPRLNTMLYINPHALEDARALDQERATRGPRGPLHGIPVVLKDNFDTNDMPTTAGSIAMAGFVPRDDAFQVARLRAAGVVFVGKTNLHEFARGIETVSSLGGRTRNPYDPRRNPGGSSGGTGAAVAAGFAAVGMGSDTCGSIRIPAALNNLFGLRVTQGLSSRNGIVPLSHTQDVGGPLARSMIDLVSILDATVGSDPDDDQTSGADAHVPPTYRAYLRADALRGARLGVLVDYLDTGAPYRAVTQVVRDAIDRMEAAGAELIEVRIDGLGDLLASSGVIDFEFTADVGTYLRDSGAPIRSIAELLDSGNYHAALEDRYRRSAARATETNEYRERLARRDELAGKLRDAMAGYDLDALIYPTMRTEPAFLGEPQHGSVCQLAAHSGFPAISIPAGFTPGGLPVGLELAARPFEEGRLVALAYAWEQLARPRRSPPRTPSLVRDDLAWPFVIRAPHFTGRLRLDRPTQVLYFDIRLAGLDDGDSGELRLHRGDKGPVIGLLGTSLTGSWAVPNEYLDALTNGELYLHIGTRIAPGGALRGRILRP